MILDDAKEAITGPRRVSYGPVKESFQKIADAWSDILIVEITPQQVALCMVALKIVRECYRHDYDNLMDIIGYTALVQELHDDL